RDSPGPMSPALTSGRPRSAAGGGDARPLHPFGMPGLPLSEAVEAVLAGPWAAGHGLTLDPHEDLIHAHAETASDGGRAAALGVVRDDARLVPVGVPGLPVREGIEAVRAGPRAVRARPALDPPADLLRRHAEVPPDGGRGAAVRVVRPDALLLAALIRDVLEEVPDAHGIEVVQVGLAVT